MKGKNEGQLNVCMSSELDQVHLDLMMYRKEEERAIAFLPHAALK
jgi:hypothetical protein